jgi:hypothetical protein
MVSVLNPTPEPTRREKGNASETTRHISGAAASSRITDYQPNSGKVQDRTVEALLAWAKLNGVATPDYIKVVPRDPEDPPTKDGKPVDAKYFVARDVQPNQPIFWDNANEPLTSIFSREAGAIIVNMADEVVQNDEHFLHVLAHEVFEITELKKLFDECGGAMPAGKVYELIEPMTGTKNIHWYSWEWADGLVERLRIENERLRGG